MDQARQQTRSRTKTNQLTLPRLYPILDTALLEARHCSLEAAAAAMLETGARILQIRHKGPWTRHIFEQARRVRNLCEQAAVPLIVNDRADIALLLNAGLHLGQDDLPPQDARRLIGATTCLGYSTHNAAQLTAAAQEPVDYLAIGPLFATQSKMNPDPVVGMERLRAWRHLTTKPLVAIGGITRENAQSVLEAGANSVAVIGDLLPSDCSATSIGERFRDWQRRISE
jgi:thiamine-phosphate pyrophosphorylase